MPTKKLKYSGGPTYSTLRVYYANISYLRVNLAKVLIGFDSKNEDFWLSRLLISLLPSDNLDKKDERRFKLALILSTINGRRWLGYVQHNLN